MRTAIVLITIKIHNSFLNMLDIHNSIFKIINITQTNEESNFKWWSSLLSLFNAYNKIRNRSRFKLQWSAKNMNITQTIEEGDFKWRFSLLSMFNAYNGMNKQSMEVQTSLRHIYFAKSENKVLKNFKQEDKNKYIRWFKIRWWRKHAFDTQHRF